MSVIAFIFAAIGALLSMFIFVCVIADSGEQANRDAALSLIALALFLGLLQ